MITYNLTLMLYMIGHTSNNLFSYVCFSSNVSAYKSNLYIDHAMNIIRPSTHELDFGVSMSRKCTCDFHISNVYTGCSSLADWILRTFTMRDPQVLLILFKSLVQKVLVVLY